MLHTVKQTSKATMLRRSAISVAIGMCFMGAALAAETGGLRIAITGAGGKPVAGATVRVSSPSSLVTKTGTTEADGTVRIAGLDPATDYKVEVVAPGYSNFSATGVAVVSNQNPLVSYAIGADAATQQVVVTGSRLVQVDTTSATVGTILNLGVVESLPTGRSYQSYLQLVPGVKPSAGGNPSSKSGVNYSDIDGATGSSSDNVYILDGVDVTDPSTGTFGSNINSEIIQEQQILTGGIPAEFAGGSGLVSKVITKSGGNEFHGSVNYYFQNDNLVADYKNTIASGFSTYDAAVTLGGPIIKDKLWFFGSYQKKARETDVVNSDTGDFMRTVNRDDRLGFLKLTWQATENDRLVASFFNDPTKTTGSTDPSILNNRDRRRKQGGDNYNIQYSRDMDNLRVTAYAFRHIGEVSDFATSPESPNTVIFQGMSPTLAQVQLGGYGTAFISERNRDEIGLSAEYFLETATAGTHTFKVGFMTSKNEYFEDSRYVGSDKSQYTSINIGQRNATYAQAAGSGWTSRPIVAGDIPRVIDAMNAAPAADRAYFYNLLDTDRNGVITDPEVRALRFNSTAGNPGGQINLYRALETVVAPYSVEATGKAAYLQDTWTKDKLTINAGIRAEEWVHKDSKGGESARFDWKIAPRLSVVYDPTGEGRSKVWGFLGRYYDPIRTNMSDFAGNLTGPVQEEQIFVGDRWLTFRTRGGEKTPDAIFSPSTKTPYTDEFMLGYATNIGRDWTASIAYTKRRTRDILEDYDLHLYSDPSNTVADEGYASPGSAFYLPYSYFGFSSAPNANYVLGTLAGGKRDYQGVEVSLTKAKRDNWMASASYTWNEAKGNTNSDSNADFQGDWIALDPRAPNAYGPQPGNIKHQFKGYGTYYFDNGLELSGVFNWNSGLLYTRAQLVQRRYLPVMDEAYVYGGVLDTWIKPGTIGSQTGPSYYTLDMRLKYTYKLAGSQKLEFFVDLFNVLDKQSGTVAQALVETPGKYKFGQAKEFVEPRRLYLGARYSF